MATENTEQMSHVEFVTNVLADYMDQIQGVKGVTVWQQMTPALRQQAKELGIKDGLKLGQTMSNASRSSVSSIERVGNGLYRNSDWFSVTERREVPAQPQRSMAPDKGRVLQTVTEQASPSGEWQSGFAAGWAAAMKASA